MNYFQNEPNEEPINDDGSDDESPTKSLISSTRPGLSVKGSSVSHVMENPHSLVTRLLAALFYGVASFLIMVVNKNVLTTQQFPSFQVSKQNQSPWNTCFKVF